MASLIPVESIRALLAKNPLWIADDNDPAIEVRPPPSEEQEEPDIIRPGMPPVGPIVPINYFSMAARR